MKGEIGFVESGVGVEGRILHYSIDLVLPQESINLIERKKSKIQFVGLHVTSILQSTVPSIFIPAFHTK